MSNGEQAAVVLCPSCKRSCSEDELSECAVCDEKYCYKCPGDCHCYTAARIIRLLNSSEPSKDVLPIKDVWERAVEEELLYVENLEECLSAATIN